MDIKFKNLIKEIDKLQFEVSKKYPTHIYDKYSRYIVKTIIDNDYTKLEQYKNELNSLVNK